MEWPKVTLFGDSITRRSFDVGAGAWGSMIASRLVRYFDVDVRGFSGYNSKLALQLMPRLFPRSYLDKVEIFTLFFGHNDSFHPDSPLHVPLDEYEHNMRSMVRYLLENGLDNEKIILIAPGWYYHKDFVDFARAREMPETGKSFNDAKSYSEAIVRIANDWDCISVVNFFDISSNFKPLNELFCDGLHLSERGAQLLFENLMPIIEKKIEIRFKKPVADLWHAMPHDQIPEIEKALGIYREARKRASS